MVDDDQPCWGAYRDAAGRPGAIRLQVDLQRIRPIDDRERDVVEGRVGTDMLAARGPAPSIILAGREDSGAGSMRGGNPAPGLSVAR
ncbi:hypothetical protein [Mangrovactinospora gilvigrisea]|uniref:hypothetical protein n=1 Tax=Mangrovactinospora gilvigrisea TaxID=1428644 RepID=UPI001114B77E|nr:hypothetical protein [Mangrovactinospora gilvigrisea]